MHFQVVFIGSFVDWSLRIMFCLAMFGLYMTVIVLPFVVGNWATTEVGY